LEAKKRFGISILNYSGTSNHIHLLIRDDKGKEVIPQTMQLVAGRTGQEYNQRKNRKGAFWEDRYQATAVEAESHLSRCMVYIDLNMVRAGVVTHPSEWPYCGYGEIQDPRQRNSLIDYEGLMDLFGGRSMEEFKGVYRGWVKEALEKQGWRNRQPQWTESIAVGSKGFVRETKERLGAKAMWRGVVGENGTYELRESLTSYEGDFGPKNVDLRLKNAFYWDISF
jgi:putative transposase